MKGPVKVLFVHPTGSLHNPVLTVFAHVARHIDRERFQAYVALDRSADGTLDLADDDAVITRWDLATRPAEPAQHSRAGIAMRVGPSIAALARYARRQGIDIVHVDGTPSCGGIGLAVARLARVQLLVHLHDRICPKSAVRRVVQHTVVRQADRLVAVSQFLADEIRAASVTHAPVYVVPNGIDLSRFNPSVDGAQMRRAYGIGQDEPLALQLGRLIDQKRQQDFLGAFALALPRVPALRGLVIGWDDPAGPPTRADLHSLCAEEGLDERLSIAEGRPEAPELMAAADILVSVGLRETSGLVAMEAMATARPVIGARSGGTMEIVVDGETGFLIPPRDPAALAEKLVLLASDERLRRKMGAAGRRRAEREFDHRLLGVRFGQIYEELAGARLGATALGA